MGDYLNYFNKNTNKWCFNYLFKRLAFLGNKELSQFATVMFMALWHGYFTGYFTCFLYEFLVLFAEGPMIKHGILVKSWQPTSKKPESERDSFGDFDLPHFVHAGWQKIYYFLICSGWCQVDFSLLTFEKYGPVFEDSYYYGHVYILVLIGLGLVLPKRDKEGTSILSIHKGNKDKDV